MTTRPYSDCLALALALVGVPDSNADEVARMKQFINRRARRAYGESPYWPRWFVAGEERIVSEEGLLPYEEDDKRTIGTCLRIHATEPYKDAWAGEYVNYVAESEGVQIAGYEPREISGDFGITISGTLNPDITGTIEPSGTYPFNGPDGVERSYYSTNGNTDAPASGSWWMVYYSGSGKWTITYWSDGVNTAVWESAEGTSLTPGEATGWTALIGDGTPVVEDVVRYAAWITYQAAFEVTYGADEGEEDEMPAEFHDYCAHGAAADWLRAEKEYEAAALMDADAINYLTPELERVSRQSGQHAKTRVLTHANMQPR